MAKIIDETGKEMSEASVIGRYFRLPGEPLAEFMAHLKKLTPADKTELALGAAKELGLTVVD